VNKIPEKIGKYQVLERVGRGGMGVLYRGVDPVLDREVAIKVMLADFSDDAEQMRPRFYREAKAVARLQHRNIVTIFEFAEEGNTPYIVMEFLRGTSLAARMEEQPPLTLDDKLDLVAQLCAGLQYAHDQGIVHRDVKPANVFLLTDGTVKLLDFGIAKLTTSTMTRQGDVLGSASYMSPEQITGAESVDGRADVFSTGIVLYELLAGRKPFEGPATTAAVMKILHEDPPPLETLAPELPRALVAIVHRALQKDPSNRFGSAGEFGRELQLVRRKLQSGEAALDQTQVASTQFLKNLHQNVDRPYTAPGVRNPVAPAPARPKWIVPAAAAGVLIAAGAGGFMIFGRSGTRTAETVASAASSPAPSAAPATPSPKVPAVTPASAEMTTLKVSSEPAGAAIFLDDRDTHQITPGSIQVAGAGPHKLKLQKRGFQAVDRRLAEADLRQGSVSFPLQQLEAATIPAVFNGPYAFDVRDGSRVISPASKSHALNLPPGRKVRLVAADYFLDQAATIEAGDDKRFDWQAPALGKLDIRSRFETCALKVGNRDLGSPPLVVTMAAGLHAVDLVCPDGRKMSGSQTVNPGSTSRLIIP